MLPAYPSITTSDLIEAAGIFLPIFEGGAKPPLNTALHAGWVLQTYAQANFFPPTAAPATLGVRTPNRSLALTHLQTIKSGQIANLQSIDWWTVIITVMEELLKLLMGTP